MTATSMRTSVRVLVVALCISSAAQAGGPLLVGGPGAINVGQPFTWDPTAMPIRYRVDSGPLSRTSSGVVVVDNAMGLARLQAMFNNWQQASHSAIAFEYAGVLQPYGAFAGGDVATVSDFNAVQGSCNAAVQNPMVFDADGSIVRDLGLPPDVIGFAGICRYDEGKGYIVAGFALLNGQFQDGARQAPNYELSATQFDEAMTHELGHFIGLDHSQINVRVLDVFNGSCNADDLAGLPLMFPVAICQARADAGLPILAPDDQAWIAKLYPGPTFAQSYGSISGIIFFSDELTQAQGVNVIARQLDDPATPQDESRRIAFSAVSGFLFTGNPGQSVTGDNTGGSKFGSRDVTRIGYYEIPVLPGTYTIEVESINANFRGGSSVGPLDVPIPIPGVPEFWDLAESAFDDTTAKDPITVSAGQTVKDVNIILNGTPQRFDDWEDNGAFLLPLQLFSDEGSGGRGRA